MTTHEKIIALDFNYTNSVRSIFLERLEPSNEQKRQILSCVIVTSNFKKQTKKW